jgi:hypothetical protein
MHQQKRWCGGKPFTIEDVLRAVAEAWTGDVADFRMYDASLTELTFPNHNVYCKIDLTKPLSAPENEAACAAVLDLLKV